MSSDLGVQPLQGLNPWMPLSALLQTEVCLLIKAVMVSRKRLLGLSTVRQLRID